MEWTVIFSKICNFFDFYFNCQNKLSDLQLLLRCVNSVSTGLFRHSVRCFSAVSCSAGKYALPLQAER
ncbi:hypothetical protein EVA_00470 [gut metagenome]|uniref:Uncharacterized protein n=1 Tax=gut metagenome TaxID=749906 RepID=J9H466_9ZZZZ